MSRRRKRIDNGNGRQMTLLDLLSCAQKAMAKELEPVHEDDDATATTARSRILAAVLPAAC